MSLAWEICCEPYQEFPSTKLPRCLPRCGHDLCSGCLALLCANSATLARETGFRAQPRCPHCRCPLFAEPKSPVDDEAGSLATSPPSTTVDATTFPENDPSYSASDNADVIRLPSVESPRLAATPKGHFAADGNTSGWKDWPVLRCALQLPNRMDYSNVSTLVQTRVIRAAPTELLQLELLRRRRAADGNVFDDLDRESDMRLLAFQSVDGRRLERFARHLCALLLIAVQALSALLTQMIDCVKSTNSEQRIQLIMILLSAPPLLLGSLLIFRYPMVVQRFHAV